MPTFIFDPDALEKLAVVEHGGDFEGEHWLEFQRGITREEPSSYRSSFQGFLDAYLAERADYERLAAEGLGNECVEVTTLVDGRIETSKMLYGMWGWNRYFVLVSGEIVYVDGFGHCDLCLAKAIELGIRVVP